MSTIKKGLFFVFAKKVIFGAFAAGIIIFSLTEQLGARPRQHRRHHYVSLTQNRSVATNPVQFSKTVSKFFDESEFTEDQQECIWEEGTILPFSEFILSWNAHRPTCGTMTFWVNVKHGNTWSGWQRLAEWGAHNQRSFTNKNNLYVHTKHVRVEMQRGALGRAFKVKITCKDGAPFQNLKALFACVSNLKQFKIVRPDTQVPSALIRGVPKQSQMVLDHPRYKDLCSPTSTSILVNYFLSKMYGYSQGPVLNNFVEQFAEQVHDNGKLNIYGNWQLNVAQAYDAVHGDVFFKVERLGCFNDLYAYLKQKIPVAVSVRRLKGGALPYYNGHFIVVVGWSKVKQAVLCIDPAFEGSAKTLRAYKIKNFLRAWARSVNLSYIPIPQHLF